MHDLSIPSPPKGKLGVRLQARQFEVFHSSARFRVLVAGRRFGKTELALAEIMRAALLIPGSLTWYIGPTRKFAKRVMWRRLKKVSRPHWASKPSEHDLRIELDNGSTIVVNGAFHPDDLRGEGLDFVIIDEAADVDPEAWSQALRPALADRQGRALFMGTPKGRNHLYDYFELAKTNHEWASFQFTTEEGGLVEKAELEVAGREVDDNVYRQEFQAEFTAVGRHRVYLSFDRAVNVRETHYHEMLPLIWTIDFNVDPMCMLLMQQVTHDLIVLQEVIVSPDATTEKACRAMYWQLKRYSELTHRWHRPMQVHVYGDASGNQRRTSGSATDWTQIQDFFRAHIGEFDLANMFRSSNPPVRDRVNCVNARLRNRLGEPRLFISPSCKELIRDFEEVTWALDSNGAPLRELDKSKPRRTHTSDALGYVVAQLFPLRTPGQC